MRERESNRYEELRKAEKAEALRRQEHESKDKKPQQVASNIIDDTEQKLDAYKKLLEEKVKTGRITPREMNYEYNKYSNHLAMQIKHPEGYSTLDFPRPTLREQEGDRLAQRRAHSARMATDDNYRRRYEANQSGRGDKARDDERQL